MDDKNSCRDEETDEASIRSSNVNAGSPGGQSNSSSGPNPRDRIVELLPETASNNNDNQPQQAWVISADFYNEDVAQNSDADDTDNEDPDYELPDHISENQDETDDDDEELDDDDDLNELDGYVIAPASRDQDSSDSDEDDRDGQDGEPNYDTSLPVGHHYLGDDLEESRGRRIEVENSLIELPLINLRHIVLLPGQTLPINTEHLNPQIHRYLRGCITRGLMTLGFMAEPVENPIGTTAEIRNYSAPADDDKLKVIVVGRQRFKLLSAVFETATTGRVKILPEIELGLPYPKIPYLQRFNSNPSLHRKLIISKHPRWLLQRHEARNIVKRILFQIKDWYNSDTMRDYNDFSYWVASNLPMSNHERMKALTFLCTEARLIWIMEMLERCDYFGCSGCKNVICHKKNVFPMSRTGPQCSYINSHGYIHDTLTVRGDSRIGLIQEFGWSRECCWFPGYEWRFAHCDNCNRHIGWCYKSINPNTKPRRFFGLSRANIRLQSSEDTADTESVEVHL